ncbi:MAG: trigger factor, partial [Oscillospiraceae bacterium]|nr:trigger factor [Oscillospiraceae bacterium]
LEKIASVENITISNEELEAEYAKFAEQYKMDVDKIKSFISSKELVKDLEVGKALDLVKESAEIS